MGWMYVHISDYLYQQLVSCCYELGVGLATATNWSGQVRSGQNSNWSFISRVRPAQHNQNLLKSSIEIK